MNIAILSGVLASEVKTTAFAGGTSVARFRLKTTELISVDGTVRQRSTTHFIDVWSKVLQTTIVPLMKEGDQIELRGSIESRNMAKAGETPRWITTVVVRDNGALIVGNAGAGLAVEGDGRDKPAERPGSLALADTAPAPRSDEPEPAPADDDGFAEYEF